MGMGEVQRGLCERGHGIVCAMLIVLMLTGSAAARGDRGERHVRPIESPQRSLTTSANSHSPVIAPARPRARPRAIGSFGVTGRSIADRAVLSIDVDTLRAVVSTHDDAVLLHDVPLTGGRLVDLEMTRYRVATNRTQFVMGRLGGADQPLSFDPDRVIALRGHVAGDPQSHAVLICSEFGGRGSVTLAGRSHALIVEPSAAVAAEPLDPQRLRERRRLARTELPPGVPMCGMGPTRGAPAAGAATEAPLGPPPKGPMAFDPTIRHVLELAIETDYEFLTLFNTADGAMAYVVELYAAVADIFERDLGVRFDLTFVRLWDDPMDLFNEPNPLPSLRIFWNTNMTHVERDTTQFLSGRRNVQFGGIAYFEGACSAWAYSVVGYARGFFPDPLLPSHLHYDLHVAAHELGHSLGAMHTHDYGIDTCDEPSGPAQRGSIMSYCAQTRSGGAANRDSRFHITVEEAIRTFTASRTCLEMLCITGRCGDCNNNNVQDSIDIERGFSLDVDGNGLPDDCQPDCNDNDIPDAFEVEMGMAEDAHGNGILDECEADCDENSVSDYTELMASMTLDINRNTILDGCEDCDDDGVPDRTELAGAHNVFVATHQNAPLREFHAQTGVLMGTAEGGWTTDANDVVIRDTGRIYVSSGGDDRIVEFDRHGVYQGDFVPAGLGGLDEPGGMVFGPDGHLYVSSRGTNSVLRYHGSSGAFLGEFVTPGSGGLVEPFGLAFDPSRHLFVTSATNEILEYDDGGAFVRALVTADLNGGLMDPHGIVFNTDRRLLVASTGSDQILSYDRITGEFLGQFNNGGTFAILTLDEPWCIRVGPDDDVYVTRRGLAPAAALGPAAGDPDDPGTPPLTIITTRIYVFDWETGNYVRSLIVGHDTGLWLPTGFDFYPGSGVDCNRNGRQDSCDIDQGISLDRNGNGQPDECECFGDLDDDGEVSFPDVLNVITNWGACNVEEPCPADINGDGEVTFADILVLLVRWGPCF